MCCVVLSFNSKPLGAFGPPKQPKGCSAPLVANSINIGSASDPRCLLIDHHQSSLLVINCELVSKRAPLLESSSRAVSLARLVEHMIIISDAPLSLSARNQPSSGARLVRCVNIWAPPEAQPSHSNYSSYFIIIKLTGWLAPLMICSQLDMQLAI